MARGGGACGRDLALVCPAALFSLPEPESAPKCGRAGRGERVRRSEGVRNVGLVTDTDAVDGAPPAKAQSAGSPSCTESGPFQAILR